MDESGNNVKGVRLQGFKGFKLNRNAQILYKPAFSKTSSKTAEKVKVQPKPSSILPNNLSSTSTLPSPVPVVSKIKLPATKNSKSPEHKSVMAEMLAEHRKIENVKRLFASLEKSPNKTKLSHLINNKTSSSNHDQIKLVENSKENTNFRAKSPSHQSSRPQKSSKDYSSRGHRGREIEYSSRRHSPKRRRRSRSRDNFYQNSHERHRSRSRERRRSRDRYRSRSREKQYSSFKNSRNTSYSRRTTGRSHKRKASVSSSSTSDSSDDDEIMRRVREKRMQRSKSPETYSVRKKAKSLKEDLTKGGDLQFKNSLISSHKSPEKSRKQTIDKVHLATDNIPLKPDAKMNGSSNECSVSPKKESKSEKSSNSAVPLASIGCWLSDGEDAEYEVSVEEENLSSPDFEKQESNPSSEDGSAARRNVFDTLILQNEDLPTNEAKVSLEKRKKGHFNEVMSSYMEDAPNEELNQNLKLDDVTTCEQNEPHYASESSETSLSSESSSENLNDSPSSNDTSSASVEESPSPLPISPERLLHQEDKSKSPTDEKKLATIKDVEQCQTSPVLNSPPRLNLLEESKPKETFHEDAFQKSENLFEKLRSDLLSGTEDTDIKEETRSKQQNVIYDTTVVAEYSQTNTPTVHKKTEAREELNQTARQEKASSSSSKLVHPAKKRYHEWFKSMAQEAGVQMTEQTSTCKIESPKLEVQDSDAPIHQSAAATTVFNPDSGEKVPAPPLKKKQIQINLASTCVPNTEEITTSSSDLHQNDAATRNEISPKLSSASSEFESTTEKNLFSIQSEANSELCLSSRNLLFSSSAQLPPQSTANHVPVTDIIIEPAIETKPSKHPVLPKKRSLSFCEEPPPVPPPKFSPNSDGMIHEKLPEESSLTAKALLKSPLFETFKYSAQKTTHTLPGQNSPESPLFSPGQDSPMPEYTMSDGDSCDSDMEDLPPVEIRIPIDNVDAAHIEPLSHTKETSEKSDQSGGIGDKDWLNSLTSSLPIDEATNDGAVSDISSEEHSEARRRSARIKTKLKKKKMPLVRASSLTTSCEGIATEGAKENYKELVGDNVKTSLSTSKFPSPTEGEKSDENPIPPSFERIIENVYLFEKKKSRARKEIRRMLCECINYFEEGKQPCGENCLNRLLMIECSARCPMGEICTNKMFQRRQYVNTEVFQTSWKGWGLRAAEFLNPGKLVMEYCGEVLDPPEFYRRSQKYSLENQQHFYFMALSQDEIIDATYKGNNSRFINHSCDPNCETQKWTVNGRLRVGFFTLRNIPKGEEITFDYQFARYGKEAQVCYCGTSKCRGYLGKPPNENDDVAVAWDNGARQVLTEETFGTDADKEKKVKSRKERYQETSLENEISRLTNGLQTTKEVLLLSRLMVRSDTVEERMMCLKVLRKSDNQACLRSFLQFHGLPLIWSWMVDVSGTFSAPPGSSSINSVRLKAEILQTLTMLPITNKNILEDSKVLSMVKRWSDEESAEQENRDQAAEEGAQEDSNNPPAQHDGSEENKAIHDIADTEHANIDADNEVSNEAKELENEKERERKESLDLSHRVLSLTAQLLTSWKDLKEIYRIPKKTVEKVSLPDEGERNEDRANSRTSSPSIGGDVGDAGRSKEERDKSPHRSRSHYEREHSRDGDRYRISDHDRKGRRSPKNRWKEEEVSKVALSSNDSSGKFSWLYNSESSSTSRLSRKEHRLQFERDMRERDEKKNEVKELNNKSIPLWPAPSATSVAAIPTLTAPTPHTILDPTPIADPPLPVQDNVTFTSSGYSGNLIQINPTPIPPSPILFSVTQAPIQHSLNYAVTQPMIQPSPTLQSLHIASNQPQGQPISVIGAPPAPQVLDSTSSLLSNPYGIPQPPTPNIQLPQATPILSNTGVTILGYQGDNAIVLLTPEQLKELTEMLALKSMQQQAAPSTILTPQQTQQPLIQQPTLIPPSVPPPLPEPDFAGSTPQIEPSPLVGGEVPMVPQPVLDPAPPSRDPSETRSVSAESKSPPRDPRPPRLPPNWKTASDADGCVYYYHAITRQTQWEAPNWDASEEDMVGKKGADMDISTSPLEETSKKADVEHLAATAMIASGAEQAKKAKETFRKTMSQHVVNCLSAYRKPDCKTGRITSTEDFKKLARKLTHNILLKEIKQVRVWEDLECNANVKHKAKEYVRKYMAKMGPIYKSKDDDSAR